MKTNMANTVSRKDYISPDMVNLDLYESDVLSNSGFGKEETDYVWDWGEL